MMESPSKQLTFGRLNVHMKKQTPMERYTGKNSFQYAHAKNLYGHAINLYGHAINLYGHAINLYGHAINLHMAMGYMHMLTLGVI